MTFTLLKMSQDMSAAIFSNDTSNLSFCRIRENGVLLQIKRITGLQTITILPASAAQRHIIKFQHDTDYSRPLHQQLACYQCTKKEPDRGCYQYFLLTTLRHVVKLQHGFSTDLYLREKDSAGFVLAIHHPGV
jgi:hypothetical protein